MEIWKSCCIIVENNQNVLIMLIRNFTNDDIMQYSLLHDINWNKIDKSLSLIIFDDKGNIEAYIIIEQNGVCPEIIYEEDSKSNVPHPPPY